MGSYTDSPGIEVIRRHVAEYIERRDGIPADWQNIVIGGGNYYLHYFSLNLGSSRCFLEKVIRFVKFLVVNKSQYFLQPSVQY